MRKGLSLLLLLPVLLNQQSLAQDYRFSQFYNTPILINPANTGHISEDFRASMNYRNQWSGITDAFKTFTASFDMPMFEDIEGMSKMGAGLQFLSDQAGTTNYGMNGFRLSLAYHTKINRYTELSGGLVVGYGRSNIDLSNVKWESQHNGNNYDPSLPSGERAFVNNINYLDAGLGVLWSKRDPMYEQGYEVGLSVYHVNFPNHSYINQYDNRLRPKIQLHGGIDIAYPSFVLKPRALAVKQGPSYSFNVGSMIRFKTSDEIESKYTDAHVSSAFEIGAFYGIHERISIIALYEFKKRLMLALSYDFNLGKISRLSSSGGFEIALRYQGLFSNKRIKIKKHMGGDEKKGPSKKKKGSNENIRM